MPSPIRIEPNPFLFAPRGQYLAQTHMGFLRNTTCSKINNTRHRPGLVRRTCYPQALRGWFDGGVDPRGRLFSPNRLSVATLFLQEPQIMQDGAPAWRLSGKRQVLTHASILAECR